MSDPFAGMPGVDETSTSVGADPFAGMPGAGAPVAPSPDEPASKFTAMMGDPKWGGRIQRLSQSWGMKPEDPAVLTRLAEPMGFRTYSTLSQLADTGNVDEANGIDKNGKPTGLGLRAALSQFGSAGGAFRRRDDATISRIAAGQDLEVGDTRPFNQQMATGMAGMPAPNIRNFKKLEAMTRAEQDATVPTEVLDIVNQFDSPEAPMDPVARAQKIYDVAQAGAMSRERVRRDAADELAIREELTGKSDGALNTLGNLAAKGLPTVGYGNTFLVGSWALGAAVSGMDKTTDLLAADIDPETGKVLKAGDNYDLSRIKGYSYGTFEGLSEVYTGKVLGTAFKWLDKATGGYVGKTVSKSIDKAAQAMAKTALGRGIAEFGKGVQRVAGLSALDNPATEVLEEAEQQWADKAFSQRASDTEAPVFARNVFNETTGQIEQVPVEPGSEEEATAKRQIAHYGDKSEYVQAGTRQQTVGEKTSAYAKDFYTWENMGALAEGFALQYALTMGGGALHAVKSKDTRAVIDRSLLMAGANNADLVRMSDEQKAEAFEKYYGSKENQAEFAAVFKDSGQQLSDMAQRMQDARIWEQTGNSLKPNFTTDLAKTLAEGAPSVDDEASGLSVTQAAGPTGMSFTVSDRDGLLNDVTVANLADAQQAAERMSQLKQGRQADMNNRAEVATRVAQTFAPGRKMILVQSDADMQRALEAEYAAEGATIAPAAVKADAKGATTPGGTLIVNVAAATGVPDLVNTITHETGHSAFTQAGLTKLMAGKGAVYLAAEFQKAKVIPAGPEARTAFVQAVRDVKAQYAAQGVQTTEAGAVEEVLAKMNEGAEPVVRKRFGDSLKLMLAKQMPGEAGIKDAARIVADILYSGKSPDVKLYGGASAWAQQGPAFTGDPLAPAAKAAPATAGAPAAPAPTATAPAPEAPVPAPAAPVETPKEEEAKPAPVAEEVKPAPEPPKEPKMFKSEEDFIAYASQHEAEVQDWTQGVDFDIEKPAAEPEAKNAVQKQGSEGVDVRQQAGDGEAVGKGNAEGGEATGEGKPQEVGQQPAGAEAPKPEIALDGGTAADIEADKAKLEAQQKKQKEREEIEAKAKAHIVGTLGDTTPPLPGMTDVVPDDLELLNRPPEKPKEAPKLGVPADVKGARFVSTQKLPGMGDQHLWEESQTKATFFMPATATPAEVEARAEKFRATPAAEQAPADTKAEVEFTGVPYRKEHYAEIPGVSMGGKRVYLNQRLRGEKRMFVSGEHLTGVVRPGMAVLLRTKGQTEAVNGVRIVGGGKAPEGSEKWTVKQWSEYNQSIAKGDQKPTAPVAEASKPAPAAEVKPVEAPPAPAAPKHKFASQADFESFVMLNPDKLEALEKEGYEIESTEAAAPEAPAAAETAPSEPIKPQFVPPLKGLTETRQKYEKRVAQARQEWEAEQAKFQPSPSAEPAQGDMTPAVGHGGGEPKVEVPNAKDTEEAAEVKLNAETSARVDAIPDEEYLNNPALAVMKVEIPAYEARKTSATRTADSIERQAYSTPPPLAAIGAAALAGAGEDVTVVEPTAGNGGLIAVLGLSDGDKVLANELDEGRANRLRQLFSDERIVVTQGDYATESYQQAVRDAAKTGPRAFLMNPPFGPADESGLKLEHRVALKTIESAKPGDTFFFIGAAPGRDAMKMPSGALAGAYTTGAFAKFHAELNRRGWVPRLHFIADGSLYKKMGAAFPVEVLLMEKGEKPASNDPGQHRPMRDLPARYSTWDQILAAVENLYNPGAETLPELLALNFENPEKARSEANNYASSVSKAMQAERVEEAGSTPEAPRYRLSQDIELGMVTPQTDTKVPKAFLAIYGKAWDQAFAGKVFNPAQLAERIISMPPELAEAYIKVADAIADHLKSKPENNFSALPGYSGMGLPLRDAFQAKWNATRPTNVALEEDKAQVPYSTMSDVDVVSPMMVPRDLGLAVSVANGNFLDRHPEGVDAYVAGKMGWTMAQVQDGRLDGSQLDTLAAAIEKIDAGSGYIVGSMTGAGKGRVMAAVMAYHLKNGRMPVFLTAKANLFTAMWEDIQAIGEAELFKPLVLNNYKAPAVDENDPDAEDADGFLMPQFFTPVQRNAALADGQMPTGATALFLTYSQVQTNNQKKIGLIEKVLTSGGALVMDEAHLAAGADSNTGAVLRHLADMPRVGVVFSSATFAKRGENMTLYKRAGYSQFFENDAQMEEVLLKGGVPFQQFLAARLTEQGYYIRHELDYTGITFEKILTTDTLSTPQERTALSNREEHIADVYNQVVRTVMRFAGAVKAVNSKLQKGAPGAHMDGEAFMSSLHNTASFIYTALKAETVANAAVKALREGRAPVISLYNTNQALLEEIGEGNPADVGRYLMRIAEKAVSIQSPDGTSASILTPEGFSHLVHLVKEADAERLANAAALLMEQAQSAAQFLREQNLPASPIDRVKDIVEAAGFRFAELTGRSLAVDKYGIVVARKRPRADDVVQEFNHTVTEDGKPMTAALLNSAGATGLSIHNSPKFKNRATREMFVLQPAWDINEMMQMFGRVNRKDQLTKPIYRLMFTSAAGEQRNAAILMQKLRSLSANTSGVSKAGYGESSEDALDFMNAFGDKALMELTKEQNNVVALINDLRHSETIRRATAISQFLPVRDQAEFIAQVQARVAALQEHARESGAHDLEAGDIGRVPLSTEQLSTASAMSAFEVPVTGKGKILTAADAISIANEWREKHPDLLEKAQEKINKAREATNNPWLHRIYGQAAQVLENAVDSVGRVYRLDATPTSERMHFIPMEIKLTPSGVPQTISDWRVKVAFNNIRGVATLPLSIFATKLMADASHSYDYNYNNSLTRKEDRTLISGDIAKALIGSIDAANLSGGGMPRIVRATPHDGNFASFVLMMPRGITVSGAKKIVSARRVPLTDIRDIKLPGNGGWLDIDAGRVRVAPVYSPASGEISGATFGFRIRVPVRAKSRDVSIAAIMRAAGLSHLVNDTPDREGYVTGDTPDVAATNKALAALAKLDPALQAMQIVSDEASVGGHAGEPEATQVPRYRFAPVASMADTFERMSDFKLRRHLISSLGYSEAEVAGMGRQGMLRAALNADSDPYFKEGQAPRYRLGDPVQVGELRTQSELEQQAHVGFPILEHMRAGGKLVIPYIFKGGEYDWFKEMGGMRAFTLAEQDAFFRRPATDDRRTKGNIDSLAKELGYEGHAEFADAFLREWKRSRALYAEEKARQDMRRGALSTAREKFAAVRDKKLLAQVMGKAVEDVAFTLPPDIRADFDRVAQQEGEDGARHFILSRYFDRVLMSMSETYSLEGRDDQTPPEVEDRGTFSRPEVVNAKTGATAPSFQQTKARLEIIAASLYAPNPEGVAKITDEDAAAWVRSMVENEGADTAREMARDMVAQRVSGRRPTPLTKNEAALMLWYQTDLEARTRETDSRARDYMAANNLPSLERVDLERDVLIHETLEYLEAARKYGSAAGQALQALKLRVDKGFNLVKIYRQAVKDNGGIALTPEQYAKLRDRVARLEEAWRNYVDATALPDEEADLEKRVTELEAEIGGLNASGATLKTDVAAIQKKRDTLESVRQELARGLGDLSERKAQLEADVARLESEIAFRTAMAQDVEKLQAQVDALNEKILALDAEYAGVDAGRLASLEAEIAQLEAEYAAKRTEYEKVSADLKTAEKRLATVRKLLEKLAKKGKAKIERRREVLTMASNLYGIFKAEMEKAQLEAMAERWRGANPLGKVWIGIGMTRNIIRALQSMGDESVAGRQLAKLGLAHPLLWSRAFAQSQRLIFSLVGPTDANGRLLTLAERSDRALFEMDQMLREHPLWPVLRKAGLDWMDLTADPTSFDEQQVPVSAFLRAYMPKWTGREAATTLLDISNNHYAGMSNMLRFYVAAELYEKMQVANGGTAPTEAEVQAIVTTVDIFGGRGDLNGKTGRAYVGIANKILYSPRLAAANVQFFTRFLGMAFNPTYSLRARRMMATEYLRLAGMYGVLTVVALALSKLFSDDPDKQRFQFAWGHPAFLQFMMGQNRIDLTGGFATWARYAGSIFGWSDRISTETGLVTGERPAFDANAFVRLIRSKLEPWAGMVADVAMGKTYGGQAAGPRATPNQPGYKMRYLNMLESVIPAPLLTQTLKDLVLGDKDEGIEPMRNPLILLPVMSLEMLGVLAGAVPVNANLAQEVEAGYTRNAEKLEKLRRKQQDVLRDKKMSPELKEIKSGRLQTQIDAVRGI